MIKVWNRKEIVELWNAGRAAREIVDELKLDINIRTVQRIGARYGDHKLRMRARMGGRLDIDDYNDGTFRRILIALMVERGDDPHKCALCGVTSEEMMTIHHTKYVGATLADLVFACMSCQSKWENKALA